VETVLPKVGLATVDRHKSAVAKALAGWAPPGDIKRKRHSDEEIIDLIRARLEIVGRSSSRMLRHLRDVEVVACEQTRFKGLYKRAVEETAS
jgi:hypothetical protein